MTTAQQIAEAVKDQAMHDRSAWYDGGVGGGFSVYGGISGQDIVFWLGVLLLVGRIVIMGFDIAKRIKGAGND
tara:strand:+ start:228 stop:446 length:219 start_codon:yes stop_codon:yes gene_type:complete